MREKQIYPGSIDTKANPFDRIIEGLLITLLAFMPLAFGAVEAWSEQVVIALAAAISICFLLKLVFDENANLIWSWTYIPIAIFVLTVVFQLVPLPSGIMNIISPKTATTKISLLDDLPNSGALLQSMTLSFYPNATKHNIRLLLCVVAVFFVVINVYRGQDQIKRLLAVITIIGGSIAVLALSQDLFGNGKIYWIIPTGFNKANSGTFINHSHYGQFMNLSIGAALGLIIVKLHEIFRKKKITPRVVYEKLCSPSIKIIWILVILVVIGATTIFVSLTRGGIVSMLMAAGLTVLILSSRSHLRGPGWIMVIIALGAFICILYVGFDAVYDRLATLQELNAYKGRWQIVKDIVVAWTKFPLFGTGFGTHEVVYPMFDRSTIPSLAAYAENEYAQTIEETGIIGLSALVVFGILIWISYVHNIKKTSVPIQSAAYGLGFGLMAIMLHSLSDFGQHLPANAILSAIFCALLVNLNYSKNIRRIPINLSKSSNGHRNLRFASLLCITSVWIWALLGANGARLAEAHWKKALAIEQDLMENDWLGSNEKYVDLISNAAAAADYQPDDVKYQHWLNIYRWKAISRITDPNTGEVFIPEEALEFVNRIIGELHDARLLCPTYGATYCVVGQLEKLILDDPNGIEHIREGFQLAPCDPVACFVTGLLDIEEEQIDDSFEKFSRAIQLDRQIFESVVDVYINQINRPDLAVTLARGNSTWLSQVADALADTREHKDIVEKAQTKIIDLLREKCSGPDASPRLFASLANVYRKESNNDEAIKYYRRALDLEYSQVQWRFALARLLAETNRISEAIHEARICLRLSPNFKAAERLIAELSILPVSVDEKKTIY